VGYPAAKRVYGHVEPCDAEEETACDVERAELPVERTAAHENPAIELDGTEAKSKCAEECVWIDAPGPREEGHGEIFRIHRRPDDDVAEGVDDDQRREKDDDPPAERGSTGWGFPSCCWQGCDLAQNSDPPPTIDRRTNGIGGPPYERNVSWNSRHAARPPRDEVQSSRSRMIMSLPIV
jgi:hypothetical protein